MFLFHELTQYFLKYGYRKQIFHKVGTVKTYKFNFIFLSIHMPRPWQLHWTSLVSKTSVQWQLSPPFLLIQSVPSTAAAIHEDTHTTLQTSLTESELLPAGHEPVPSDRCVSPHDRRPKISARTTSAYISAHSYTVQHLKPTSLHDTPRLMTPYDEILFTEEPDRSAVLVLSTTKRPNLTLWLSHRHRLVGGQGANVVISDSEGPPVPHLRGLAPTPQDH